MGITDKNRPELVGVCCPPGLLQAEQDHFWMQQAYQLAAYAEVLGEVPVGALIIKNQQCIAIGYNQSIALNDPTAHAEIIALRSAGVALANYRLPGTTLYVTLEPCAMCATAMVHARIERLVFGATDLKAGAAGSVFDLTRAPQLNHLLEVQSGIYALECSEQLSAFFKTRRQGKKRKINPELNKPE